MVLVSMSFWVYLVLIAASIFSLIYVGAKKVLPGKARDSSGLLYMGLFLALFDFLFETAGALLGYWTSHGSLLALWFVPVEVFFIALFAGAAFRLVFPHAFNWATALASSLVIACMGAGIESLLIDNNLLVYSGGWTSYHAFVAYFFVFLMLHGVNSIVKNEGWSETKEVLPTLATAIKKRKR